MIGPFPHILLLNKAAVALARRGRFTPSAQTLIKKSKLVLLANEI
jgi:hypothetical protein